MKRVQFLLEEEVDAALTLKARREGVSKGSLIRQAILAEVEPLPPLEDDPLWKWIGMIEDGDPTDSASVDDVVYPRE